MILIGHLTDDAGAPAHFSVTDRYGTRPLGIVRACYCNDCGEVTLTIE